MGSCSALFQPKFGGGRKPSNSAPKVPPPPVEVRGAEGFYGITAPVGFFDPLGLATDKSEFEIRKYREAELKVGRADGRWDHAATQHTHFQSNSTF